MNYTNCHGKYCVCIHSKGKAMVSVYISLQITAIRLPEAPVPFFNCHDHWQLKPVALTDQSTVCSTSWIQFLFLKWQWFCIACLTVQMRCTAHYNMSLSSLHTLNPALGQCILCMGTLGQTHFGLNLTIFYSGIAHHLIGIRMEIILLWHMIKMVCMSALVNHT